MFNFKNHLSQEVRDAIEWRSKRIDEIYHLSDADLADWLLLSARELWCHHVLHVSENNDYRADAVYILDKQGDPVKKEQLWQKIDQYHQRDTPQCCSAMALERHTYRGGFTFDLIPELAKRLTGNNALKATTNDWLAEKNGLEFRCAAGSILNNTGTVPYELSRAKQDDCFLLERTCVNGNPVEIALSRVYPPESDLQQPIDRHDVLSCLIHEVSSVRTGGTAPQRVWTPSMQDFNQHLGLIDFPVTATASDWNLPDEDRDLGMQP